MNRKNTTFEMLTRVADFANRSVSLFPRSSSVSDLLETLESGVKVLSEEASNRLSAEATIRTTQTAKEAARNALKAYLLQAGRVSRALHSPDIKLPVNPSDHTLIDSANRVAQGADSMKKDFIELGLPKFAESVSAVVDDLKKAAREQAQAKAERSAAIQRWNTVMASTQDALRRFDVLVANVFKGDSGKLASYASARAIPHVRARKVAGTPPASQSTTTTAVATTAAA